MQSKNTQDQELIEAGPQAEEERMKDDFELGRLKRFGRRALLY